eukprot:1141159-Pelagomonas_calceolata.AAC.3
MEEEAVSDMFMTCFVLQFSYCGDTRPGQQFEAAQRQHADLCENVSGKAVTLHTILLGVVGLLATAGAVHALACTC